MRTPLEELLTAYRDLEAAQGEWVTGTVDNAGKIDRINQQLARDLSDDQAQAMREILNTATEGSAEWLSAWQALQSDLTGSQRQELVAQRADLEAHHGAVASFYTGDAAAAEDAQKRIETAQSAISKSYRQTVLDMALTNAGGLWTEDVGRLAVALGLMSQAEADYRVSVDMTTQKLATLSIQMWTTFMEDGHRSREETELLAAATNLVAEGIISADLVMSLFNAGVLGDFIDKIGTAYHSTTDFHQQLMLIEGPYDIDVDSSDLDTARRRVDDFPTNISLTVDVTYNDPGYMPGPGDPGYVPGTDSGPVYRSTGGPVPLTRGAMPGRDSVRAWLTPGEYVLTTADVARLGGASGVRSMLAAPRLGPPDAAYNYPSAAWGDAGTSATPAPGNDTYIFNVPDAANARLIAQVVRDGRRANRLLYAFGRGDD